MALVKWEPSEGLAALRREMNRLFEGFFEDAPRHSWERPGSRR